MTLRNKRALVTGGAGFIGSHVVDALVAAGAEVTALDNLATGDRQNLAHHGTKVRLLEGDLRRPADVDQACAEQDLVFHFGANADVPASVKDPDHDFETNVVGSQRLFRACLKHKVGRLIFASSAAVYGNPESIPMAETHPLNPVSPYGASKLAGEQLGLAYHRVYGLPFTSVRIFNTYGERQPRYVMFDLLRKLQTAPEVLEVLGTGQQQRDFCHISDACQLFLQAALVPEAVGQTFNLAGGFPVSIEALALMLIRLTGLTHRTAVRFTGQSWPGDIPLLLGDTSRARRVLAFSPRVSLEEGLSRLIIWSERERGWTLRH